MKMRKPKSGKRRTVRSTENVAAAIRAGRALADEVIAFRAQQRRRSLAAASKVPLRRRAAIAQPQIPAKTRALIARPESAGVLIAEGDSWFDYPFHDVLQMLEDEFRYEVESVAHKGDCIEDMAHSGGQFEEFARRLEKLLRDGKVPRAILLSGGGNDIAGDEFAILLNHAASSLPTLNEDIVRGVIDVRLKTAYVRIISALTAIAQSYLNRPIPIITHGYDYALPDGRGFLGGFWLLPGPWLKPGFQKKGYDDFEANIPVVVQLMDRFNSMLDEVSATPQFAHVHYLNLRKTLMNDGTFKTYWANELHPTEKGFRLVTGKFAAMIERL